MRRALSLVFSLVILISSIGGVALTVSAADIAIQAEPSIDDPVPGEAFNINVDLSNVADEPVQVTDIYVRKHGSGVQEYNRAKNLGAISGGGDLSVPVSVTIDETGQQRLDVHATVKDSSGEYSSVSYPIYVDVESPDEASVSFTNLDPVAGDESQVNVSVSNGDSSAISNVRLNVGGDAGIEDSERVYPSLAAGERVVDTYNVTFPNAGEQTIDATVQYRTSDGATRTATFDKTTDVEAADVDTELSATVSEANGSSVIRADLTEYGNADLTDIQLRAIVDGEVVKRALVSDVHSKSTGKFTLDSSDIPAGEVTIAAEYSAAGEEYTSNTTINYNPREQSNLELTGIEAVWTGSTVTVSGETANLGSSDASSVLVNVANTSGISPTSPNGEYFVGNVESSEFATFELTANANQSVDSIPAEIRYSADGKQFVRTVQMDVSDSGGSAGSDEVAASSGSGGSNGSGIPLMSIGIVLVLAVIGAAGLYWRRRQS